MSPETPKEAFEASKDNASRLEEFLRRGSRIEGQIEALEYQITLVEQQLPAEIQDTLVMLYEQTQSDATTIQEIASDLLQFEAGLQTVYSLDAALTRDASESEEYQSKIGDLGCDFESVATALDDVCHILEIEIKYIQAIIHLETDAEEMPVEDIDTIDVSTDSLLSRVEKNQSKRKFLFQRMEENSGEQFDITETKLFE